MAALDDVLDGGLLGTSFACECGRTHHVPTRSVVVGEGAIERAPAVLDELAPGDRVLAIGDRRTWAAVGRRLDQALLGRRRLSRCVVPDAPAGEVHASVELVADLARSSSDAFDVYVAVGSGTVNDLTKALAHQRGRPYVAVATAASMNGYTSSIVALLEGGLKTTAAATPPVAVLADTDVLCRAPLELTLAGLGDLVSKPYSGCDWWIASLLRDEPYCSLPGRLLDQAFTDALDVLPRLGERDPAAVVLLAELLLVSGITMTIAGTSSPASGGEHLLSHFWDMRNLAAGRALHLHGAQVGVASVAVDALYGSVLETDFAAAPFVPGPSPTVAKGELEAVFGTLVPVVWPQWRSKLEARSGRDLELLAANEEPIKTAVREVLATGRQVRRALAGSGAPMYAADLGISREELRLALRYGRTIRTRTTVLDVAAELSVLEGFAAEYPDRPGRKGRR